MTDAPHISDLFDDEQILLTHLWEQLQAKRSRNHLRASYYDGKHAVRQIGAVIPPQYYRLAIVLGWSAQAVDILASRCNLDGFVWPDGDLGSIGYRDVFDANRLTAEVSAAVTSSLIYGVSFLITTQGDTSAGEPAALIHTKDATNATGIWDVRRRSLSSLLSITDYDQDGRPTSLVLYLDGETVTAVSDGGRWEVDRSRHPWGMPAEPLVFDPRPDRPFGASRISRAVMSHHDSALRTLIRMEGHADIYSFPELWLLGADESIFKNADGSQKASWQVMLGRIKGIPDDEEASSPRADVKQFSASSPQPHIDQLKLYAQVFSGVTNIPLTALGVTDAANPTSADAYINSREELIAKAEVATDAWAPPLRNTMARALAMANNMPGIPADWSTIGTKWRSPMHLSRAAQADAGLKQLTAVPWLADTEVGLELLGLDEQQIARAMADKRRAQGRSVLDTLTAAAARRQPPPVVVEDAGADRTA